MLGYGNVQHLRLPPHVDAAGQRAVAMASEHARQPFNVFPYQRVAGIPEDIQLAHRLARQIGQDRPFIDRASQLAEQSTGRFADNEQRYMNPYQRQVVDRIAQEGNRNFNEQIMPSLAARFAGLGQFGSSRHADLSRRAARDTQGEIMANQARAMHSGYESSNRMYNEDQNRMMQAARDMSTLGHLTQAGRGSDINALTAQGLYQQHHAQEQANTRYSDFLRQENHPYERASQLGSILNGMPMPASQFSTNYAPNAPQGNGAFNAGNAAANLVAMRRLGTPMNLRKGGYVRSPALMGYLRDKQQAGV